MSDTFKKYPGFSAGGNKKGKKLSNRRVRYSKIISNGGFYKKLYESWNICDYKNYWYSRHSFWEWCKEYCGPDEGGIKALKLFYKGYKR